MALTGYMFPDSMAIGPFLEPGGKGPTSQLACELATRLDCYVVAGYPESLPPDELPGPVSPGETEGAAGAAGAAGVAGVGGGEGGGGVGYNSAVIAGPSGVIGNYRKTFLFETDKVWCRPGDGFGVFDLEGVGRVAVGICMGESASFTRPSAICGLSAAGRRWPPALAIVALALLAIAH